MPVRFAVADTVLWPAPGPDEVQAKAPPVHVTLRLVGAPPGLTGAVNVAVVSVTLDAVVAPTVGAVDGAWSSKAPASQFCPSNPGRPRPRASKVTVQSA